MVGINNIIILAYVHNVSIENIFTYIKCIYAFTERKIIIITHKR